MSVEPQSCAFDDFAPVRQPHIELVDIDMLADGRRVNAQFRHKSRCFRGLDARFESNQPVENSLVIGEEDIVVHKKCQSLRYRVKGPRRLGHDAESDLARKEEWRCHDKGNDRAELAVERGERGEILTARDDLKIVLNDRTEALLECAFLRTLATKQRNLLGVFPQPCKREAEICLVMLALKRQPHERPANEMGHDGADRRVDYCGKERGPWSRDN